MITYLYVVGPGYGQQDSQVTFFSRYNTKQRIGKGFTLEELKVGFVFVVSPLIPLLKSNSHYRPIRVANVVIAVCVGRHYFDNVFI